MNQPQPKPDYRFYATLLDAFTWYQASENENAEQEFLDKINRVPVTDPKALERMNKGTAMNDLIDELIENGMPEIWPPITSFGGFDFETSVVTELGLYLIGSTPQHYTETTIDVNGKSVTLYGYIDYVREAKCIDLKTTSSYDLGKYKGSMQRHLYPFSLSKEGVAVEEFEFLVTDFNSVFKEPYLVDLVESEGILKNLCAQLISFIESKKHLITDKKIFGLEVEPA